MTSYINKGYNYCVFKGFEVFYFRTYNEAFDYADENGLEINKLY